MKQPIREPFAQGARAVVLKPFTFKGKAYKAGATFPWARVGCSERKARQLWENRFINCVSSQKGKPQPEPEPTPA